MTDPTVEKITPSDVHPTHDVREEGILVSDPVCQKCRASVYGSPDGLWVECPGSPPTIKQKLIVAAWYDVQAERQRQVSEEGWTHQHDDGHNAGELAAAAACYAYGEELEAKIEAAVFEVKPTPQG